MLSLRRGQRSCSQGNVLRPAMPDASSTTCTEYPRRPQRPHSRDRSKRLSDEIRQQELLERFRGPLKVAFVTTACFGWNCACVFARSSDSWLSRLLSLPTPSQQWTIKAILDFAHGSNALSDVILMVGLYCLHKPIKDYDDMTLCTIIRIFTLWNGLTALLIWCTSCVYILLPYFPAPLDVGKATNSTNLPPVVAATPDEVDSGVAPYIFAVLAQTVLVAAKVFLLFYVYVDYIYILQDDATVTVANVISLQESSASQADAASTWERFIWRRKGSRHSRTHSRTSGSKHPSTTSSPPAQRNLRTARPLQDTAQQPAATLEPWFEQTGPTHRTPYDDEGEGAPLDVVPNKNPVSYVYRHDVGGAKDGGQKEASSHRLGRNMSTFDAMQMVLFGGGRRTQRKWGRHRSVKKGDESSTGDSSTSATPSVPSVKKTHGRAPSSSEFDFEGYLEKRRWEADAQKNEPEQRPALESGGSETDKQLSATVTTTTDQRLLPTAIEATRIPDDLPEVFARTHSQVRVESHQASTSGATKGALHEEQTVAYSQSLQSAEPTKKTVTIADEFIKGHEKDHEQETPVTVIDTSVDAITHAGNQTEELAGSFEPNERGTRDPTINAQTLDPVPNTTDTVPSCGALTSVTAPCNGSDTTATAPQDAPIIINDVPKNSSITTDSVPDVEKTKLPPAPLISADQDDGSIRKEDTAGMRSGGGGYLRAGQLEREAHHILADSRTASDPHATLPPVALGGPVLVKDRPRQTTQRSDDLQVTSMHTGEQQQSVGTDEAAIREAANTASQDENAKDSRDTKREVTSDEEHTTEMTTGAFSLEVAHTDKVEGHDNG